MYDDFSGTEEAQQALDMMLDGPGPGAVRYLRALRQSTEDQVRAAILEACTQ